MKYNSKMLSLLIVCMLVAISSIVIVNLKNASAESFDIINYSQRSVYDEKEDGWIYTFEIYYPDSDKEDNIYMFDGYNLKYKKLDGFYVPVIDRESGKVIDKITPEYITLSISEKYGEDIRKIVEFFNKKQFVKTISENDLNELNINTIEKKYLVDIYNRTIESELKTEPGKFNGSYSVGKVNLDSSDKNLQGELQLSYLIDYGNIIDVNIEFIDKNGTYLSDKSKEKLSSDELALINEIDSIENNITSIIDSSNAKAKKSNAKLSSNNDINTLIEQFRTNVLQ